MWVSEVMLQQTQAARVVPAYPAFLERFATVEALAAAPRGEVIRAWGTLGYPRRAVALSEAARAMVRDHGGRVPDDPAVLRGLPGFGAYTSAAVAALGYGRPVTALDTNVRRVTSRAVLGLEPHRVAEVELRVAAQGWLAGRAPGDVLQGLMDLGRTVCRPRPRCDVCPLAGGCRFLLTGGTPERPARRQPGFAGSMRQVRGLVLASLRLVGTATLGGLVSATGRPEDRVAAAVRGLHADGVVAAGPAALAGSARGRVRLPD
ncbi:MAG: A/G-specific adenine glycosylase [Actinomycetota bacterium]